ncbi:hypothetical protein DPEC_G00206210 [Dallia pectoralis]|uniref:Uncharacterized protein n=1 Tax=Dallia pectoralis TaxID=75939 RepID=A0ACC2G4P7_DALPE|nr:hypothetical protein DPEC_G00206210 [Dallia pectoralis]
MDDEMDPDASDVIHVRPCGGGLAVAAPSSAFPSSYRDKGKWGRCRVMSVLVGTCAGIGLVPLGGALLPLYGETRCLGSRPCLARQDG